MNVRDDSVFLYELVSAPSPSGQEEFATRCLIDWFLNNTSVKRWTNDKFGNVWFSAGHGPKKILLSAHIDEVYAVVTNISDDGMISLGPGCGIDRKDLAASIVQLLADDGTLVDGIVIKNPIHIENREKTYDNVLKLEEMRVDIGADSKKEVLGKGIHPGTSIVYSRACNLDFGKNRLVSVGLDDKIGVFVAAEVFSYITNEKHFPRDWENEYTVYMLAAVQEEVGCRGVCSAVKQINPDVSIDFDVTFATDGDLGLNKSKYGDIQLGKGPVICYGPEKSLRLNRILIENSDGVHYQQMASRGGTDTDNIQKFSYDCETTLVSIPNRAMHTRVETCDWRDVQWAVDMVSHAIMTCKI